MDTGCVSSGGRKTDVSITTEDTESAEQNILRCVPALMVRG
jgi:hypothetical protein